MIRIALAISIWLGLTANANAWSSLGHEAVALIAERHLTAEARSEVARLLGTEGKHSLAEVAVWADAVRKMELPRQPRHAVWIPPGAENYVAKRDCPPEGCAVDTIEYAIGVLSDDAHPEAKLLALKYLVHLVGDIHQPFHAMEAKGYLMAGTKQTTLHRAWDSIVVAYPKRKGPEIAALIDRTEAAPNLKGDAEDWAWESHVIARDIILPRAELFRRAKPAILPPDYAKESWPIAAARLKAAGMRLAWTLNDIYAPGGRAHSR